jgi:large subunit ribosomal protein L4
MATITVYNAEGSKTGEITLDPAKLDKTVRKGLLKESLIAFLASQRQGSHKTKDRGEVAGGGKKPWRQKGTGRARQGSTRSPQWVGGGRAHGPIPRDYAYQLPVGSRKAALMSSVRWQLEQGRICAVDGLDGMAKPRTKKVAAFLAKIGLDGKGALLVSESNQPNLYLSTRNLAKVTVSERRNLNAGEILKHAHLIFTKGALDAFIKSCEG